MASSAAGPSLGRAAGPWVAWIRRRGRRRLSEESVGCAGRDAGSGAGASMDRWRDGRGGLGGEPVPAQEDDHQPGEHVGQGHHDQRRGPGSRAGDVVGDAEGGDGRAGAVGRGEVEDHPGPDAGDPHARRQGAGAAQRPAVGAGPQVGG